MKFNITYSGETAKYNNYDFRLDKDTKYYLSTKKIGQKRKRLHCYVWETEMGQNIPNGYAIHHKDHNKGNNDISNLQLVTATEHAKIHNEEMTDEQKNRRKSNVVQKAMPKAVEWHKSQNGNEWHKAHYEQMKDKWYEKAEFVCVCCGKKYIATITGENKFCSNGCKSKYRRMSGADNETRKCECCGKEFATNKYSKAKFCSRKCAVYIRTGAKRTA